MVREMSRHNESHGADRKAIVTGNPSPHPGISRQIPEQGNGRTAYVAKLLDVRRPGDSISRSSSRRDVLIVAGQRRLKSPRKPERPKCKRAFRIRDVV